jgi:hypothetical protein
MQRIFGAVINKQASTSLAKTGLKQRETEGVAKGDIKEGKE